MARTRKTISTDLIENKEEKSSNVSDVFEIESKSSVIYLPNHTYIEFKNGKAIVNKEQYNALKKMGAI